MQYQSVYKGFKLIYMRMKKNEQSMVSIKTLATPPTVDVPVGMVHSIVAILCASKFLSFKLILK